MGHKNTKIVSTTELLKMNLTDFIEEVRQDILRNKYGGKLINCIIVDVDIMKFLKEITNNFDLKSCEMVYGDIEEAICDIEEEIQKEQPLVFVQLQEALKHYLDANKNYTEIPQIEIQDNILNELETKKLYFTREFIDKERQNLFNGLISGGFIPKDTNADHFNFVFGGIETADFKPIQWLGGVSLLAYFIDNGFADTDRTNIWKITENCFTIKGQKPKGNSMKSAVCKYNQYKNPPKGSDKIDAILKNL